MISYFEPCNFCICSGHFTFKSNLLLLRNTDIQNGLGDHSRRFCTIHTCWSQCEPQRGLDNQIHSDCMHPLPMTISFPETRTPSVWKTIVPASSFLRLDNVRACFFPRAVTRQFPPDFNLTPSLVQEPSTSAWLSSTSTVTVSVSCALVCVKPFTT